jgi:glutathione S-transferase
MRMIRLYQFPYSPFCIVARRILEFGRIPHQTINIPNSDRKQIWKITKQRYYQVPVIKDGRSVVFETDDESQVIAKYLDNKFKLGLFPAKLRGEQMIYWRWIEDRARGCRLQAERHLL